MRTAYVEWIAVSLMCGCIRLGYDARSKHPDLSRKDAGIMSGEDSGSDRDTDATIRDDDAEAGGAPGSGGRDARLDASYPDDSDVQRDGGTNEAGSGGSGSGGSGDDDDHEDDD